MSIFFSDRTHFSEQLILKDTLQLLCKYVRRINLHISGNLPFLMDLCEVACCRKKNIPKIDFTVNKLRNRK